jgi:diguanylate cyclase (GGDEF)-like protein/PAS domain S-box-containing protein
MNRRRVWPRSLAGRVTSARPERTATAFSAAGSTRRLRSLPLDVTVLALTTAGVGLIGAWLILGLVGADTQRAVTGFVAPIVDLVAAVLVAKAARSVTAPRVRVAWALIAVGMLIYAIGDGIWAWIAIVEGADPFPSAADVAYVAFYPIVAGALLLFPVPSRAKREAVRLAIDSAIVVVGGGMVVWHSLFLPALTTTQSDAIDAALTLGYPIGDLVLVFAVATIALRRPTGIAPRALVALVAGLVLMFIADVAYGELALVGSPIAHWIDFVYFASSLAIALAGYLQAHAVELPSDESVGPTRWQVVLPYAGLAAGFGVLLAASAGSVSAPVGNLLLGAVALTVLVLIRQELTNRENAELLADRVRRDSEARYKRLEGQATDAVLLVDAEGVIAYASSALERVLGLESTAILGKPVMSLAHAADATGLKRLIADTAAGRPVTPFEWQLWSRDGGWRQVETVSASLLDDPTIGKIVLTTRDVRERKALTQQLTQAAFHDLLTDLPNRALFVNRVGQALASAQRRHQSTAILTLDLDGFTRLNDSLGHAVGDQVLLEVARRLSRSVRAADTAARLGGDEFAVLLDGSGTVTDALEAAERIRSALRAPMTFGGTTFELTAGISIATSEQARDSVDPTVLTRNAHVALSIASASGHDHVVVFAPSMQEALVAEVELESDLRRGIAQREFVLHYQPIVDLGTRELVGAEALVRWDHPTRGRVAPDLFIPIAEETGLIAEIGAWVLRTACLEVAQWARRAPHNVPRVSVNLASAQLADPNLAWTVQSALAQAGAAPGWLTLELTERQLVQDTTEVLARLHAIRALGVQISIDDFGTGYSSLAYLQQFPVSHIKIDRSFVTPLDDPDRGNGVAGAIVEIGRALGMSTIAEGIETERQLERLLAMGCPLGQGYLLGRPLDAAAMLKLVAHAKPSTKAHAA